MGKEIHTAIVLSAGKGSRMQSEVQKQYMDLAGKPVLYYSLQAFEECSFIDRVILVAGEADHEYCRTEIIGKYRLNKVCDIVAGGKERYDSVYEGLKAAAGSTYVYIHDGARPFLTQEILSRSYIDVKKHHACAVAMPVKDTIKISDENGYAEVTPARENVWMIQTPQVFLYNLIKNAYSKIMEKEIIAVTDDAMVLELVTGQKVKLTEGSYRNIKITTPEDLEIAALFVKNRRNRIDI